MKRLNGNGPFVLLFIFDCTLIYIYSQFAWERPIQDTWQMVLGEGLAIIGMTWRLIWMRRIYFDDENIYLKSYFVWHRIVTIPLKDVTFERTNLNAAANFMYLLTYQINGKTSYRFFYPPDKYRFAFKRLVDNHEHWGIDDDKTNNS